MIIGTILVVQTILLTCLCVLNLKIRESVATKEQEEEPWLPHVRQLGRDISDLRTETSKKINGSIQGLVEVITSDEAEQQESIDFVTATVSDLAVRFSDLEEAVEMLANATESDSEASDVLNRLRTLENGLQTLEKVLLSRNEASDPALMRMKARDRVNQQRAHATQMLLADELPPTGGSMAINDENDQDGGVERVGEDEMVQDVVPDGLVEAPLKPVRGDNDPMITDLRAEPFRESPDAYDNMYDLSNVPGVEDMDASRRGRAPRPRGPRRI